MTCRDFLAQFELIKSYNKWSDEDAGFELASSLEEGARSVISTLPEEKRCDYKSLCQALRNRFQAPGSERKSAVGIWNRLMQKNEDVFAYANVLRQMEKEAYPAGTLGDTTMIGLFLNGLRDTEVVRYVRRCNPTTFDEAVEIAARDEADAGPTSMERTRKPRPDMIAKIDQMVTPQNQNDTTKPGSSGSEEQKSRGPRKPIICFRCQEPGHIVKDCPYPRGYTPPQSSASPNNTDSLNRK